MYQLNQNVIYIKGFKNGAIYDFNSGKVFWVNEETCELMNKIINHADEFTEEEASYIHTLVDEKLYSVDYKPRQYTPEIDEAISLELAWLEITQACNEKCVHCYQGEQHYSAKKVITTQKWKQIISELSRNSVKRVVVIGGEPCTHKDIIEILQNLCFNKINTTLFTNGTLLRDDLLNFIIENRDLVKVKVSLYGHNSIVHDRITTIKGSFDKLIHSINILKTNHVTVDIAVVAMKENQDYLEDIRKLIIDLGFKYSGYDVIRNVYGGNQNQHCPDKPEVLEKARYSKPVFYTSKEQFLHNYNRNTCWYGKIAITETGDVLPCVFERNIVYGNVLENSIDEILNSEGLKKHWFRNFSFIDQCKDCEFRFACKDCRPLGISVRGNLAEKNPRCLYNPHSGEWRKQEHGTEE
jgi:radical SAM protein with 4Fe4S-binding SPASM domain